MSLKHALCHEVKTELTYAALTLLVKYSVSFIVHVHGHEFQKIKDCNLISIHTSVYAWIDRTERQTDSW